MTLREKNRKKLESSGVSMKSFSLFALTLSFTLLSNSLMADCFEDFRALQDKKKVNLIKQREVTISSVKEIAKLRQAEQKAVKNYINYLSFKFDGDNSLHIVNQQYQNKSDKTSLGYKISVDDQGDESTVHYYIKIDVGLEDVAYPILYRSWSNQSPEKDFLCETF